MIDIRSKQGAYFEYFKRLFLAFLIVSFYFYLYFFKIIPSLYKDITFLIEALFLALFFIVLVYRALFQKITLFNKIWLLILTMSGFAKLEGSNYPIYSKNSKELKDYLYFLELNVEQLHNISTFVENGHSIILTSKKDYPLMFMRSKKNIGAFYQPILKVIVLFLDIDCKGTVNTEYYFSDIRGKLYHEYGHYLDYSYGIISKSIKFYNYFKAKQLVSIAERKKSYAYIHSHRANFYNFIYTDDKLKILKVFCKFRIGCNFYLNLFFKRLFLEYRYTDSGEFFAENFKDYLLGKCTDEFCLTVFEDMINEKIISI